MGFSIQNLGDDSANYMHLPSTGDPLPKRCIAGISCNFNILDLLGYQFTAESDFYLLHTFNTEWKERTNHFGHKIQISPFYARLYGTLDDSTGQRYEKSKGYVITLNCQKTIEAIAKVAYVIDKSFGSDYCHSFKNATKYISAQGYDLKPNLFYTKSHSEIISSEPWQIRLNQKSDDWTIGIGFVASYPDRPKAKEHSQNTNHKEVPLPAQSDSEILEDELVE